MHFKRNPMCAELDFSRGIWAAARDGEEDRVRHLLSRFPCAAILLNPRLSTTHLVVMLRRSLFHPRGTDASQRDNGGYTGLHYAARSGHLHVVRLLLQVLQCLSHPLVGSTTMSLN